MHQARQTTERRIPALAVSRGIGVGPVAFVADPADQPSREKVDQENIDSEVRRFRAAISTSIDELKELSGNNDRPGSEPISHILDVQLLIIEDAYAEQIESIIREQRVNAEWAIKIFTDEHLAMQATIEDRHLREKQIDLKDVAERLLSALRGLPHRVDPDRYSGKVVVARELRPSAVMELARACPAAIIAERGGWTSHSSIIAREFRLPMVAGVRNIDKLLREGDSVIVDGINGQIIVAASDSTVLGLTPAGTESEQYPSFSSANTLTTDGIPVIIRANSDNVEAYAAAKRFGAEGIGLFRSESLMGNRGALPSEEEQLAAYIALADAAGHAGLIIRTFDIGIDELHDRKHSVERNPALGLRSLRLSLHDQDIFRTQIRAILRASYGRTIAVVLPMVSAVSDVRRSLALIEEEKYELQRAGLQHGQPRVGAMIEVPAAVLNIDAIVRKVDFLCLGTNDLVQYLLAVDRDNDQVADWYQSLHPAVIRAVSEVLSAGDRTGIPVQICGEIAGSAFYVPLLVGLGARELSMNVHSIRQVRHLLAGIDAAECSALAGEAARCETAEDAEELLRTYYVDNWITLFPSGLLTAKHR
jgi:phosphoenolpyruvate-protein phosphotransferase (PTS system enzyme I)